MKIGLLQCDLRCNDIEGNAEKILTALREAARLGAELCISSELALCGAPATDLLLRADFLHACNNKLLELAQIIKQELLPPLLLGAPIENPVPHGKPLHNSAVFLRSGKCVVISRKVLLATDGIHHDHLYFEPGIACGVLQYNGWRFGVTIGEDIWNDRNFWLDRRKYEQDPVEEFMGGVDALINLSAIPYCLGGAEMHHKVLSWTSAKYRCPVVMVNQIGGIDSCIYPGSSMVFNSSGVLTSRAKAFAEDVQLVDLSKNEQGITPAPRDENAELWQALVLGLSDFCTKAGFNEVLLGLSGGMDSALVAAIATDALGPENVLGVLMPSPYSSPGSIDDSLKLAGNLGIKTMTLPISEVMDAYYKVLAPIFEGLPEDTTEENIQPRIRCNYLMALSNKLNKLLLNTGNKTECAVGYSTLYGDTGGALAVIGDVYKTKVFELARWYNAVKGKELIPCAIIDKEPSAELKPGQKDSDSLPPYPLLDAILYAYLEERQDLTTLLDNGFEPDVVDKVLRLVECATFKRKQSPPALYVTDHAFGQVGFMPIASRRSLK